MPIFKAILSKLVLNRGIFEVRALVSLVLVSFKVTFMGVGLGGSKNGV